MQPQDPQPPMPPTEAPERLSSEQPYETPTEQPAALPQPAYVPPVESQPTSSDPAVSQPGQPTVNNPLAAMRPGEQIICEIRRHPIGLVGTYVTAIFLLAILAVVGFLVVPAALPSYSTSKIYGYVGLALVVVGLIELLFVYIARVVYRGNRWIVTSDSLTQVTQISLFSKRNSQLSMANLEDVTAEKNGVLCQMFNYGILKAETAGEHSKFRFVYCPNPNYYAQQILQAREAFEQENYRHPR